MTDPDRTRMMLTRRKFALGLVFAGAAGVAVCASAAAAIELRLLARCILGNGVST